MVAKKKTTKKSAKVDKKEQAKKALQECIDSIIDLLKSQDMYSAEMAIQAEVVGTDLYVYRTLRDAMLESDKFIVGSTGQQVLNPVFDQINRKSEILRKGLASLQMNKEKVTASVAKKDATKAKQSEMAKFIDKINSIK